MSSTNFPVADAVPEELKPAPLALPEVLTDTRMSWGPGPVSGDSVTDAAALALAAPRPGELTEAGELTEMFGAAAFPDADMGLLPLPLGNASAAVALTVSVEMMTPAGAAAARPRSRARARDSLRAGTGNLLLE
jgi:hypothetical protein